MFALHLTEPHFKLYSAIAALAAAQTLLALWLLAHLGAAARWPLTGALAAGTVLLGVLAWWLRRSLCQPLAAARELGQRMAHGDLAPRALQRQETLLHTLQLGQDHVAAALARLRSGLDDITREAGELAGNGTAGTEAMQRAAALRDQARALARVADAFCLGPAYPAAGSALHLAVSNRWRKSGAAAAAAPRLVGAARQEINWTAARVVQDSMSNL